MAAEADGAGELALDVAVPAQARAKVAAKGGKRAPKPPEPVAEVAPVARVVVDVPLPHLDRVFEYAVPASMAETAQPGVRVRVRFAGQDVEAFLLSREQVAEHTGRLAPLRAVVSPEPVLDVELLGTCRAVADRWAGTLADVLRLAVPRRHATTEKTTAERVAARDEAAAAEGSAPARPELPAAPDPHDPAGPWAPYPAGPALLERLAAPAATTAATTAATAGVRAVWTALPSPEPTQDWPAALAAAAQAALSAGRGALIVVPDHRDVTRVDAALTAALGSTRSAPRHVRLTADQGPAARYAAWLALRRGHVRVAVGTRAAALAPVVDPGLFAIWDDGDDLHAEPHAPYPHVREVLALRADRTGAALLVGGHSRTAEGQRWVESGWARAVEAPRELVRTASPRVLLPGDDIEAERDAAARSARLPSLAFRTAQAALAGRLPSQSRPGPVLVQVPRRGYLLTLRCEHCRARARCRRCAGPLQLTGADQHPACRWCSTDDPTWTCPQCRGDRLRSAVVGARRTAEELGRAFPGVPVKTSGGGAGVLEAVDGEPALVISTPGAEPVAEGGYAAALLLDGWAMLEREELRAAEEALRRWAAAAALVRPQSAGGAVVLLAPAGVPPVEALVRWDPAWHASRELAERRELGLPPGAAFARLDGPAVAVDGLLAALQRTDDDRAALPPHAEVLGPTPLEPDRYPRGGSGGRPSGSGGGDDGGTPVPRAFALVRVPLAERAALAKALQGAVAVRSARKEPGSVRVQLDPEHVV
ncbi:replication restart DNA helicase PriA [Quadrisphaera granulorum]|uniref:Probable replication restart protein PriA n=1 Tax=Quadrisphaera granulorum TaxID=317664 RepID=A0A316A0F3_9ACTN|nr:primosome assembly protein PriA [Quadrisphaera granulorum]PWJ51165.1 replication restart DNA helicase PriA [Quadrisphaera granulorum]SZE97815.1 replication restart DNA helicase PriA [Quadrisphaera granulorum]